MVLLLPIETIITVYSNNNARNPDKNHKIAAHSKIDHLFQNPFMQISKIKKALRNIKAVEVNLEEKNTEGFCIVKAGDTVEAVGSKDAEAFRRNWKQCNVR